MKKLVRQTLKEIVAIYFATFISFALTKIIIEIGPESTMKGWIETYLTVIVFSTVTIFILDKEISIKHKILGALLVALVSIGLIYLWTEYGPRKLVLYGLIFGYPLLLIFSKLLYKQLTIITLTVNLTMTNNKKHYR